MLQTISPTMVYSSIPSSFDKTKDGYNNIIVTSVIFTIKVIFWYSWCDRNHQPLLTKTFGSSWVVLVQIRAQPVCQQTAGNTEAVVAQVGHYVERSPFSRILNCYHSSLNVMNGFPIGYLFYTRFASNQYIYIYIHIYITANSGTRFNTGCLQ